MAKYIVKQGECIDSIAFKHGHFWETLWNLSENTELKQKRKDPSVLFPGDEVFIPDKREKTESGATDQRHRFRKKGVPAYLRLQLLDEEDAPRAEVEYILNVDGSLYQGKTDSEGYIEEVPISPKAQKATLSVVEDGEEIDYEFLLGYVDPIDEVSGQQERLSNLAYYSGPINGVYDEMTIDAVKAFQKKHKLKETGEMDSTTLEKLKQIHGN